MKEGKTKVQRVAKPSPDLQGARAYALAVAQDYMRKSYPDWWGPVADVYIDLGLHSAEIRDSDGVDHSVYGLLPGAGRVLAEEAMSDAEAFDLAINICMAALSAGRAVPQGLGPFAAGVLGGSICSPKRPTNTPVKHWKRDTTLFYLTYVLREKYGLTITPRRRPSENETTRRHSQVPSAPVIIADAFRLAGTPEADEAGVRMIETTAAKVWGDRNVKKRMAEARARRSKAFHDLRAEFMSTGDDVPEIS